ncbi:tripeptidyl peptidase A [Artomyces pyxidatus]|uniref:Tripeptidyl peptidase A n=1 Tax=Artomyces pyxidatus TaxID=48021 RepID=A0ACB8T740_9AGAM|nr:tripeptidyl peptidase A [Artomyces pyxidatus]
MLVLATFLVALAGLSEAAPQSAHKVREAVHTPRDWIKLGAAPAEHVIPLRIALPQSNFDALERHLYEISDPEHARYGQHLSKEEVEELVAPHPHSLNAVNEWLAEHGIPESDCTRSPAQDWVTVRIPVSKAEAILDTKFHMWKHVVDDDVVLRTTSYSLPEHMHEHIEFVQPTTMFSRIKNHRTTFRWSEDQAISTESDGSTISLDYGEVDTSCNKTITLSCLKQLYNAVGYKASAKHGNEIGLTGYLEQNANLHDLQLFYQDQRPEAVNSTLKVTLINGGVNSQNTSEIGAEANLDVQFAAGQAYPAPATFWSTGGSPPYKADANTPSDSNEPYTEWLDYVLAQWKLPQTISTSYGDDEQTVPEAYAKRACAGFAQLGARGVSLMFSSGDAGVGDGDSDPTTQTCFTNDGRNVTRFIPSFPASCPYVTTVGGTYLVPEVAVPFSAGGFSNYFSRPHYQDFAVEEYLRKLPKGTYKGLYNPKGRAFPDVSAQGVNFRIFYKGRAGLIDGTSASSPAFAGIVSLLNDARLSHGLPPLGFLNPLLYSRGVHGFNDITKGNNPGCGTEGFNATVGWDPVTGLGTPNFGKLKEIVLSHYW